MPIERNSEALRQPILRRGANLLTRAVELADNAQRWPRNRAGHLGVRTQLRILAMRFHQAIGPVIRARNLAAIRRGGERGRAAVLSCFLAGSRANRLSWRFTW